jgi:hypothetical protein
MLRVMASSAHLRVLGQASEDMKMDSVMSSKTWSRNSALAQASVADSILFGFSSQDWRDSMILKRSTHVYFEGPSLFWLQVFIFENFQFK